MSDTTPTTIPPTYKLDLSKYIEVRLFGERPHIRGRRITIGDLVGWIQAQKWTPLEAAEEFGLSVSEVLTALLYYTENQDMIDQQQALYQSELNEMHERYGNKS
jgi:uncharacterized protein (DUF433 family)